MTLRTRLLIDCPEAIAPLTGLLEQEWPDWYNARGASARAELSERLRRDGLPLGIVALRDETVLGTCALTVSSGGLFTERSPWVGGLVVTPEERRRGVARRLLLRAKKEARRLGHKRLHALTDTARGLFEAEGWMLLDTVHLAGKPHAIYMTPL